MPTLMWWPHYLYLKKTVVVFFDGISWYLVKRATNSSQTKRTDFFFRLQKLKIKQRPPHASSTIPPVQPLVKGIYFRNLILNLNWVVNVIVSLKFEFKVSRLYPLRLNGLMGLKATTKNGKFPFDLLRENYLKREEMIIDPCWTQSTNVNL